MFQNGYISTSRQKRSYLGHALIDCRWGSNNCQIWLKTSLRNNMSKTDCARPKTTRVNTSDVKKVRIPRFQRLDPGEISYLDFPFRLKKSVK